MLFIPYVLEKGESSERAFDIYSRLLQDRIIILNGEIDDHQSSLIISQLLYLDSISSADISIYISSPGGSISAGMAIFDTMNYLRSKVNTICVGMAASMAAFLLAAGHKRYALVHSEIMIHQPLGGISGQVTDIDIHTKRLLRIKQQMNTILADLTGQSLERIQMDTERDNFMTAKEALEYHLIDEILLEKKDDM